MTYLLRENNFKCGMSKADAKGTNSISDKKLLSLTLNVQIYYFMQCCATAI